MSTLLRVSWIMTSGFAPKAMTRFEPIPKPWTVVKMQSGIQSFSDPKAERSAQTSPLGALTVYSVILETPKSTFPISNSWIWILGYQGWWP